MSGSTADHVLVLDSFLEDETASGLRGTFHDRFSKPREGNPERFVWDWWHVPEQYTLVRPEDGVQAGQLCLVVSQISR